MMSDICLYLLTVGFFLTRDAELFSLTVNRTEEKVVYGQSFTLACNYNFVDGNEILYYVELFRKRDNANKSRIMQFAINRNATYDDSSLQNRVTSSWPSSSSQNRISLVFSSVECIDKALYMWRATYLSLSMPETKEANITVLVRVDTTFSTNSNISFSPSNNIAEGDEITFTCTGDAGNEPVGHLRWFYYLNNDTLTPINVSLNATTGQPVCSCNCGVTSTLRLTMKSEFNNIVVRCTMQQDTFDHFGDGHRQTSNIKVYYGPDGACDNVSSLQTFTEGDSTASIRCFSECYPGCSYTWSNGSGLLSNSERLSLGSARRYQAGNYIFSVSNTAQTYSKTAQKIFTVVVKYAPVVSLVVSTTNRSEGTSLTLFCTGKGVPPNYTYTGLTQVVDWVRVPNTALETDSSIHFSSLQLHDTGNYSCTMNNGIRDLNGILDQTGTVQLLVEVGPKILEDGLKYAGAQDNPITIQVPFYCYPAVQSVTFVRYDGTVIQNSTKYRTSFMPGKVPDMFYGKEVTLNGYIAVLTIYDLKEEDFVSYSLTIQNSRGVASALIFIVAESIPGIPRVFFLASGGLFFMWEKNFNGGHLQTFIIQITAVGKREWQNLSRIHEEEASYQVNSTFYKVEIKDLHPGTYSARLIAANSLGEAMPLYLNTTFTVVTDENITENPSQVVAGTIGGSVFAIVGIAVFVGVVVWRRRVRQNASGTEQEPQTRQQQFSENSYYNLQSFPGGQSTYCDLLKTNTNERSNYSDLNLYERPTEVPTYEKLKGADERDRNRTYASLCPETSKPSTNKGHNNTYVN